MVAAADGKAHPRVSGENPETAEPGDHLPGSSPRERGKLREDADAIKDLRLIPA